MPKVYHRKLHYRTLFRKLGLHAVYFPATALASAPLVKYGRTSSIGGWDSTGAVTLTNVSDTSIAVVRCPGAFLGQIPGNY
jgi:hypothetical protein